MQQYHITMLGARNVGKTSLLTSMYYEYEKEIIKTKIQLVPDARTASILGDKLAELKSLNDDLDEGGIEKTEASGDPSLIKSFVFEVGEKGKKTFLRLHFWDYPGAFVVSKGNEKQQKFVEKRMNESVAVLVAIDAPALMEARGKWHYYRNRPLDITNHFKQAYQNLNSPRLVILAPIKCESYMRNANSRRELISKIKREYASLLDLLKSESLINKVAVVITPVQTVGTIFFSSIEVIQQSRSNGTRQQIPIFHFEKGDYDAEYKPEDNEQPLKYLLRFLLKLHIDNRGIWWLMRDWLKWDEYLKEAIRDFAKDCKTFDGFEILQGKNLININ